MKKNLLVIGMIGVIIVLGVLIYNKYNTEHIVCCVEEIEVSSPIVDQNVGPVVNLKGKAPFSFNPLNYQVY